MLTLGQIASLFVISPLMQKFGRRWPILIGSLIILVGVALQAAAQNVPMFIVGMQTQPHGPHNVLDLSSHLQIWDNR